MTSNSLAEKYPELKELQELVTEAGRWRMIIIKNIGQTTESKRVKLVRILNKLDARQRRRLENYYILEKMLTE